ncbi:sensor histidine kinase [Streptomyces sp. RKAG337]|uniref:sensor histidine kinase n=1 Tax=Streptomyces sp. RKAG337 TaxID=2893404 RepID=UPI0027E3DDB3|nr:ATP-binding protein [Streptomyces sp. RKAG337]
MTSQRASLNATAERASSASGPPLLPERPGRPHRPRRLSVQGWILIALGIMAALTVLAGIIGSALLSRTSAAADHLVNQIAPARTAAAQLQTALLDQETGVRGYLLTGDKRLLEPDAQGRAAQVQAADRLTRLLNSDSQAMSDLSAVESAARQWRVQFAEPALNAPLGTTAPGEAGKESFDRVRTLLAAQDAYLGHEQDRGRATLLRTRDQRDAVFLSTLALFLVTGIALAVLLHLAVGRPLTAVRVAATRVAGGDLSHRIPHQGPADLQAMAHAVEAMRVRVVQELDASRRQETQLRQQRATLGEQAAELRRSNAELEQFAYVASHDLQEPLRKVASFCQLLEKRYGAHLDARGTQYIAFAVDGAKRMQVLINDLLTFSRVGRTQETLTEVDQDEAVDRALRNVAAALEDSDAIVHRPDALPAVTGDATLLTMLWQNLIGNAVKFRHPDRAPAVHIAAATDPDEPAMRRFTVTDNGIGIPAEFADKVFVIFQRLHGRGEYEGTGIGLSLCKKIVENSGGRIWIDSAHTTGTRIAFTLPAPGEHPDTITHQPRPEADHASQP